MKRNLRSEAAIKRVLELSAKRHDVNFDIYFMNPKVLRITVYNQSTGGYDAWAELDLRDFIKKRKPLTGVKKQLDKIVRGSKVKPKKRRQ